MIAFTAEQRILVTGASSGIGRAVALRLNGLGASVLLSGRDTRRLEDTRTACPYPEYCHVASRDLVRDLEELPAWISGLRKAYGKLSGMAFCAGQTWTVPLQAYDLTAAHKAFDICCHAPLLAAKGFADKRNNTGSGASMVFISALAAVDPNPGQGMYGAAKAALVTAVRCLSKEIAPRGIRANCISPGLVETPMMEATAMQLGDAFLERERTAYPLGVGKPENVADMATFLLSDKSSWISGQNILLTGGR